VSPRRTLALLALLALATHAPAVWPRPVLETAPIRRIGGADYVGASDLARLLEATKFWRADVRKLVLRTGTHRITLTVDVPFAVVDDRTLWLRAPVLSLRGELQAPVALLEGLPRDSTVARLVVEPRRAAVVRVPRGGMVGSPVVSPGDSGTRVVFPVEQVGDVAVVSRSRSHFRVRLAGTFAGVVPDSLPRSGLVRGIVAVPAATGTAFELDVVPGAAGYRVTRGGAPRSGTVVLDLLRRRGAGLEEFALDAPPGLVRVIVIDPAHGGGDPGVTAEGVAEKDLTLALARLVRAELARRLDAQVVLLRDDDRALTPEQRAEAANRARADLVLSLHFDAVPGTPRAGATAWCPPAALGSREGVRSPRAPLALLPWRDVGARRAVQGRAAAEAILDALDRAGLGPVRLRERLMVPLLGVDAAGVMLDCATLSAPADRARVTGERGLKDLSVAIAEGVARWARGG
jgi:N-acetylmuramoyl-L-alanine amidase